jgi:sulfotransferase
MSPGNSLRFPYDSLKEAITGPHKHKIFLLEYEQLTTKPEETMRSLYNFIGEDYYNHDFGNVETSYDEYDAAAGINGLHKIRKKVQYIPRETILPPDVFHQFSGLEVWR